MNAILFGAPAST